MGFSDEHIASLRGVEALGIREKRTKSNIKSVYKIVDTCAGIRGPESLLLFYF